MLSIVFVFLSATIFASYLSSDLPRIDISDIPKSDLPLLALVNVTIAVSIAIHCWVLSVVTRLYAFLSDRERIVTTPIITPGFDEAVKRINESLTMRQNGSA
uniref:Uncharacterized protein n=1 Tax=Ascaris lumbricoides TaxID=6252 RepID=A0A9J2PH50_ASCLU